MFLLSKKETIRLRRELSPPAVRSAQSALRLMTVPQSTRTSPKLGRVTEPMITSSLQRCRLKAVSIPPSWAILTQLCEKSATPSAAEPLIATI